jgi:hypothetical protein
MSGNFVIRRAVVGDREAVLRIAATGMREFGLEPDFHGLDADLGLLGEERPDVVAEFVAVAENAVCGSVVLTVKAEAIGFTEVRGSAGRYSKRQLTRGGAGGWGKMATAVRLYEASGWVRGEDPPASSGADRSYWLELARLTPRSTGRAPRAGERERWAAE